MKRQDLKPEERIILALDFSEHEIALKWVEKLRSKIKTFKVGPILFLSSGSDGLKDFANLGANIFLDLKFHDIPSTADKTARQSVRFGANMFTIHTLGGYDMMKRVSEAVNEEADKLSYPKPIVLGVTVLTSHDNKSLDQIGIKTSVEDTVMKLAELAEKANVDGLVCSGVEVQALRKEFGNRFTLVVPGIRPGTATHDQKRVTTPADAVSKGADYLVIGRAITEAKNPEEIVDSIVESITI